MKRQLVPVAHDASEPVLTKLIRHLDFCWAHMPALQGARIAAENSDSGQSVEGLKCREDLADDQIDALEALICTLAATTHYEAAGQLMVLAGRICRLRDCDLDEGELERSFREVERLIYSVLGVVGKAANLSATMRLWEAYAWDRHSPFSPENDLR